MERVNELLLQEISRLVTERQDPDVGFVTFTAVHVTEDLSVARIFFSVLGSPEDRARTLEALVRMRGELRGGMRRLESLRRIPAFEFVYDETPEKASRIHELIEKIHREDAPVPEPAPEPGPEPAKKPRAARKTTANARTRPKKTR